MACALVTGSDDRVAAVAAALVSAGVDEILTATGVEELDEMGLTAGVTHYVQLPVSVQPEGDTVVGRVRSFLSAGLITRFALTERVLPALTPGAGVVLVSGSTTRDGVSLPDDKQARLAFLHVLAHGVRAETGRRNVRVAVVSGERDDAELARFVIDGAQDPRAALVAEPAEAVSAKQYEDWRTEVMGLVADRA